MSGVALTAACARQGAPPGGPEDRRPPVVVTTRPDTYEVVERDLETVRFVFDERISERVAGGSLRGAVLVSPRTGEVEVGHDRDGIEVTLAGGFQPDRVYRVTLLPVVSDLFGNQMRDPFELVFSTGAELVPSAVAGLAWDRVTGRGVEGLQVLARDTRDSTLYLARTDTAGIYAFRYLPPGPYLLTAFQDRDGDGEVDGMEPQGSQLLQVSGPDTVVAALGVLQPDTTPAALVEAEPLDSQTVILRFDEPLDPLSALTPGNVGVDAAAVDDSMEVVRGPEGEVRVDPAAPAPGVRAVLHPHEYREWAADMTDSLARLDSLDRARANELRQVGETGPADSIEARTPRPRPPALPGARGRPTGGAPGAGAAGAQGRPETPTGPDGRPLPDQRVVVLLDGGLEAERPYRVAATSVVNLARVPLGGGEVVLVREPPPPPDTAADSLAVDSVGAPPDTAGAVGDSTAAAPDTAAPPRDTLPPPDTVLVVRSPGAASAWPPGPSGGAGIRSRPAARDPVPPRAVGVPPGRRATAPWP